MVNECELYLDNFSQRVSMQPCSRIKSKWNGGLKKYSLFYANCSILCILPQLHSSEGEVQETIILPSN